MRNTDLARLRAAGLRPTTSRLAVLSTLRNMAVPATHRMLEDWPGLSGFDRVTLYRTLRLLEARGLVHKVLGTDGVWRYCGHGPGGSGCPGNHVHLICTECGKMICLPDQPIPKVTAPEEWIVAGKQFLAYGICKECQKRSEKNRL